MLVHKETDRGFVSLLTATGGVDYMGVPFPAKFVLCVAEYGVGIGHYNLGHRDVARVMAALREEPTAPTDVDAS